MRIKLTFIALGAVDKNTDAESYGFCLATLPSGKMKQGDTLLVDLASSGWQKYVRDHGPTYGLAPAEGDALLVATNALSPASFLDVFVEDGGLLDLDGTTLGDVGAKGDFELFITLKQMTPSVGLAMASARLKAAAAGEEGKRKGPPPAPILVRLRDALECGRLYAEELPQLDPKNGSWERWRRSPSQRRERAAGKQWTRNRRRC